MNKGIFCISFDTELLWGRHDLSFDNFISRSHKERDIITKVLKLLVKYKAPATWAIVGHLFLDKCDGKHLELIKPRQSWFKSDPETNLEKDPLWYGKDIVALIRNDKNQEIGCHTFSHVIFGDPECSKECAESELKACISLAQKENIDLQSFVFPRNKIGHLDILKKYKFKSFRGELNHGKTKVSLALDLLSTKSPTVYNPYLENELVNIPGSMYFPSSRGMKGFIPKNTRLKKAIRGIDEAIKHNKVFHLWTHPVDFADQTENLLSEFEAIIEYADGQRKNGSLEILNMSQITERVNQ